MPADGFVGIRDPITNAEGVVPVGALDFWIAKGYVADAPEDADLLSLLAVLQSLGDLNQIRTDTQAAAQSVLREQADGVAGLDESGLLFVERIPDLSDVYVPVDSVLKVSQSLDFASIAAGGKSDLTVTVTGAQVGDAVSVNVNPVGLTTGIVISGGVSAADTVTVRAQNVTAGAIDPAAVTVIIAVTRAS